MTDGRIKGKRAERQVVAIIEPWWRKHEPDAHFVRTPMSGGWSHGTAAREGFQSAADIMTTSAIFPFSVEIKRREGFSWERFRDGKPSPVQAWWSQTRSEARDNKRVPMLWLRRSRMPWYVLLPEMYMMACWDAERENKVRRPLLPPSWSFKVWGNAMVFEAQVLLQHPPDYFIAGAKTAA